MSKYEVGATYIIGLDRDSGNLLVLLADKLISFHLEESFLTGKINKYDLPLNEYTSMKYSHSYICLYSTHSLLVFQYDQSTQSMLRLPIDDLMHVEFIGVGILLFCSKGNTSIEVWNFPTNASIGQHSFPAPILQCSTLKTDDRVVIKVTLETGLIHYLLTAVTKSKDQNEVCFTTIATLQEKLANESILFNSETDVYYTDNQSHVQLYHFNRSANNCFEELDNLPPLNRAVSRHHFVDDTKSDTALIWLTAESAVILHSCGNHFIIPGEYHDVYRTSGTFVGGFVCFLNRNTSKIQIYEWKCESGIHMYRLLACLQLDQKVSHCVCNVGEYHQDIDSCGCLL
jgi:hypothetical protein